jgi:hypothetical protein
MDGVKQAELVVQDVEKSMLHVQELTTILGTPLATTASLDMDAEVDIEQELEALLHSPRKGEKDEQTTTTTCDAAASRAHPTEVRSEVLVVPPHTPSRAAVTPFDDPTN